MRGDYRIGDWLVHPRMNSMERNGDTVHFEPKVMQVLLTLASEPGEVVTREHLRKTVWPDVFVGEDVLIRAISELRRAFSDDPREPHTIQTIPKVGYRLLATVTPAAREIGAESEQSHHLNGSALASATALPADHQEAPSPTPPPAYETRQNRRPWFVPIVVIILLALAVTVIGSLWRPFTRSSVASTPRAGNYSSRPLTTYPGSELQPSFSPDGDAVAFVWIKEGDRNGHIYVKMLGSEAPAQLTTGLAEEFSPAWSPDGRWIAFIRHDQTHTGICIMPAIGGSEEEVYTLPTNHVWEYGSLTWTADGKALIFPQQAGPQAPSVLVQLTLNGRGLRVLTTPPPGWDGDWTPAISPDGKQLAFVRGPEGSSYDIYVLPLPKGTPKRITNDGRLIVGLTWSSDSSSIIFASNRSGSISLWRVSAQGGPPEHEPAGGDNAYSPSIARAGGRLVYAHGSAAWSILAVDVNRSALAAEILTSSEQDASPHVSPSGDKIAFQSWRSGSQEIWTAGVDGSNPIQLTSINASAGSPFWSHDGRRIAFDARLNSFAHIYVIGADGGPPRPITTGNFNDIVPSWSPDDRWIYFGSNRSGAWQVWRAKPDGTASAEQVTQDGGMVAQESSDGKWLYFTHYAEAGLWRMLTDGGQEQKVFDGPPTGNLNYWTLSGTLLYALSDRGSSFTLQSIDPETKHTQIIYTLKHSPTPFAGLSLTPDGKRVIFAELDRASSGLTLVEHYD